MADLQRLSRSVLHDPSSLSFRNPEGAVPAGTAVSLGLLATAGAAGEVAGATLIVRDCDDRRIAFPMERREAPAAYAAPQYFSTVETPRRPCVLRYRFEIDLAGGGSVVYAPRRDGRALTGEAFQRLCDGAGTLAASDGATLADDDRAWFQLTVYDPAFRTPAWMHGAVMYQVFPDRFARHPDPAVNRAITDDGIEAHLSRMRPVVWHRNWNEPPLWHDLDQGGDPLPRSATTPAPGTTFEDALLEARAWASEHPDWNGRYDPVDFFGGTLAGIESRLDYLADLGVEALYLNPVCEARSNHRYDTADYEHVDRLLGSDADFGRLCVAASERGIRVVLDAVLSHTGDDSRYFNARGTYPDPGAAQGPSSEFYSWYDFEHPNGDLAPYRCWWGEPSLPEVDERDPGWQSFVVGDANPGSRSVLRRWLSRGAGGFRLDVADELPDDVLEKIRSSVKAHACDAAVIGEVWEDPTTKVSYGKRRTYALGRALDSVMNYPLREALVSFALGATDAFQLATFLDHQRLDYPPPMYACLMNLLGSHDVARIRTVLALGGSATEKGRPDQIEAVASIDAQADALAARLQAMLATLVYVLPGMPCIYYGDELGMHGGSDPFCRATMPWDDEGGFAARADVGADLLDLYRALGSMRRGSALLREGGAAFAAYGSDVVCAARCLDGPVREALLCLANRAADDREVVVDLKGLFKDAPGLSTDASALEEALVPNPEDARSTARRIGKGVFDVCLPGRSAHVFKLTLR